MQKPWEGRFKERTEEFVARFTQSVSFDKALAPWDIRQSIANVNRARTQKIRRVRGNFSPSVCITL